MVIKAGAAKLWGFIGVALVALQLATLAVAQEKSRGVESSESLRAKSNERLRVEASSPEKQERLDKIRETLRALVEGRESQVSSADMQVALRQLKLDPKLYEQLDREAQLNHLRQAARWLEEHTPPARTVGMQVPAGKQTYPLLKQASLSKAAGYPKVHADVSDVLLEPGSPEYREITQRLAEYPRLVWERENSYLTGSVSRFRLAAYVAVTEQDLGLPSDPVHQFARLPQDQRTHLIASYTKAERDAAKRAAAGTDGQAEKERSRHQQTLAALQPAEGGKLAEPSKTPAPSVRETVFARTRIEEARLIEKHLVDHPEDVPPRIRLRQLKLEQRSAEVRGEELKTWAQAIQPKRPVVDAKASSRSREYIQNMLVDPWLAIQTEATLRRQYSELLGTDAMPRGTSYEQFVVARLSPTDLQKAGDALRSGIQLFAEVQSKSPAEALGGLLFAERKCVAMLKAITAEQEHLRKNGKSRLPDIPWTEKSQKGIEPVLERQVNLAPGWPLNDPDDRIYLYQTVSEYEAAGVRAPPMEVTTLLSLGMEDRVGELESAYKKAKTDQDRVKVQAYAEKLSVVVEEIAPAHPPEFIRAMRDRLATVMTARGPPQPGHPRSPFDASVLTLRRSLAPLLGPPDAEAVSP